MDDDTTSIGGDSSEAELRRLPADEAAVNPERERNSESKRRAANREPAVAEVAAVLDALDRAMIVCTADGRVRAVNGAAERMLDRPRAHLIGRLLWDAMPSMRGTDLEAACRSALDARQGAQVKDWAAPSNPPGGEAQTLDVRARPVSGGGCLLEFEESAGRRALETTLQSHENSERGESLRVLARELAAVSDSSELLPLLTRAAQHQCAARGAAVVQVTGDTGHVVATSGHPIARLGTTYGLTGSLIEGVVQRRALIAEDNYSEKYARTERRIEGPSVGPALAVPLIARDQVLGVLAVSRAPDEAPFSSSDAERLRVIADYASLMMWKALLLDQAHAANEAKATFLATISHELRTPLTAITGYGELLHDEVFGPLTKGQLDIVERMKSVTNHLSTMIEEILAFSSLEAGREIVRPRPMETAAVVRSALSVVEQQARQKGLTLVTQMPDDTPSIVSDADKVRQILVNLLGNAVKFTDTGEVRLTVTTCPEEIELCVRDSGIGVAREDRARLFRPFSQLDTSLTRRHGGTGLGLYISQRLASMLGGRIEMDSEPGRGSAFALVLPRG